MGHFGVNVYRYSSRILHFYEGILDPPINIFTNIWQVQGILCLVLDWNRKVQGVLSVVLDRSRKVQGILCLVLSKSTTHNMRGTLLEQTLSRNEY